MTRPRLFVQAIPPKGSAGSQRGHIWVDAAVVDYFCEGVDPWLPRRIFAVGHADIARGDRFLKKLWITRGDDRDMGPVVTRHCAACARVIGAEGGAA